jgi:hypothetical protein
MSKANEMIDWQRASLGTTLVLLELVGHRIDVAMRSSTLEAILGPAQNDLDRASNAIRGVQSTLANGLYQSRAHFGSEFSINEIHEVPRKPLQPGLGRAGRRKTQARDD